MKQLTKKIGVVALSVGLGIAAISTYACNHAYRTYYLTSHGHYYYVDANGMEVMAGKYDSWTYKNFPVHKDHAGRYYHVDAWGNKIYLFKHSMHHRCMKSCRN